MQLLIDVPNSHLLLYDSTDFSSSLIVWVIVNGDISFGLSRILYPISLNCVSKCIDKFNYILCRYVRLLTKISKPILFNSVTELDFFTTIVAAWDIRR